MTEIVNRISRFLTKMNDIIFAGQKVVLLLAATLEVGLNFLAVLGRYLFNFSFAAHQEGSTVLYAVIILLGANIAVRDDNEIKIELIRFKNPVTSNIYKSVIDVLGLCVIIFMLFSSIAFVRGSLAVPNPSYYPILKFKYAYSYSLLIICFVLLALAKLEQLFAHLNKACELKGGEKI